MKIFCYTILIIACALCPFKIKAQWVTIPDANFVNWLYSSGFSQCFQGNQLDTTCPAVLNAQNINCGSAGIQNLYGIQFFKSLKWLNCSNSSTLDTIPALPDSLNTFNCENGLLRHLPALPSVLREVLCGFNRLLELPKLPDSLRILRCEENYFSSLPALPNRLMTLDCSYSFTRLDSLPVLPSSLDTLYCIADSLVNLPLFPANLVYLECYSNQLSILPPTNGLKWIRCYYNQLTSFTAFGDSLIFLECDHNQINSLPTLPASLRILYSDYNQLLNLPALPNGLLELGVEVNQLDSTGRLPDSLISLACGFNRITQLPILPKVLQRLVCDNISITQLPALPISLTALFCNNTLITTLPQLPDSMYILYVDSNPNLRCLPLLTRIEYLRFEGTGVTCLPNYGNVTTSLPPLNTVPLCDSSNQYGCLYSGFTAVEQVSFSLYPNPANDYCTLQLDAAEGAYAARFIDITGREIMAFKITSQATQIPIATLPGGLYFVMVSGGGGVVGVAKLIRNAE